MTRIGPYLKRHRFVVASAVVALFAAATAYVVLLAMMHFMEKALETPASAEVPPVDVTVRTVALVPEVRDVLALPAVVEPNRVVAVAAEVAGRVDVVHFEDGARVNEGDVLVTLNQDLICVDCARAAADTEYARQYLERMDALFRKGAGVTEDQRDRAESAMKVAAAHEERLNVELDRTAIRAPFDGTLNEKLADIGEYVKAGEPVALLVDMAVAKVAVQVPEIDVGHFATGGKATVVRDLNGDESLDGTITFISELADRSTRATRMEISVPNEPRVLRSGQIVRVRLTRQVLTNVVMAPLAAVVPTETGHVVYVVADDVARRRAVTLGAIRGRDVEIAGGLNEGDRLIVQGHRYVSDGQRVALIESAPDVAVSVGAAE